MFTTISAMLVTELDAESRTVKVIRFVPATNNDPATGLCVTVTPPHSSTVVIWPRNSGITAVWPK